MISDQASVCSLKFAGLITEAVTSAWAHYVNSNNLLSELRRVTKNSPFSFECLDAAKVLGRASRNGQELPFSTECLDVAKWQVIGDQAGIRTWNFAGLITCQSMKSSPLDHPIPQDQGSCALRNFRGLLGSLTSGSSLA